MECEKATMEEHVLYPRFGGYLATRNLLNISAEHKEAAWEFFLAGARAQWDYEYEDYPEEEDANAQAETKQSGVGRSA